MMKTGYSLLVAGVLCSSSAFASGPPALFAHVRLSLLDADGNITDSRPIPGAPTNFELPNLHDDDLSIGLYGGMVVDYLRFSGGLNYAQFDDADVYLFSCSTDVILGFSDNLDLFGGITVGVAGVNPDPVVGLNNQDDDISDLAYGFQVGALYSLNKNIQLEAGYRFLKTNIDFNVNFPGSTGQLNTDVDEIQELYLGVNYYFDHLLGY